MLRTSDLARIIPEKVTRMKHGKEVYASPREPFSTNGTDSFRRFHEPFQRRVSETNNNPGIDQRYLGLEILSAGHHFLHRRHSVLRRSAFDDVSNIRFITSDAARFEYLRQQLSGAPDKGAPLNVFVGPGRLADEHNRAFSIAFSGNDLCPSFRKRALPTVFQTGMKHVPCFIRSVRYSSISRGEWEIRCVHPTPLPE